MKEVDTRTHLAAALTSSFTSDTDDEASEQGLEIAATLSSRDDHDEHRLELAATMSSGAILEAVEAMRQTTNLIQDHCPDLLLHQELYQETLARLRGCHERHRLQQSAEQTDILDQARERAAARPPKMDIRMPQRQEELAAASLEQKQDDAKANDPDSIHFAGGGSSGGRA